MSKVITDKEIAQMVRSIFEDPDAHFGDQTVYHRFVEKQAELITEFCGGEVVTISRDEGDDLGLCVHFGPNDSLPADGGIFKDYDKDVTWKNGKETQA